MVMASPYTVSLIEEKLKTALSQLMEGSKEGYDKALRESVEGLEEIIRKYPDDDEIKEYYDAFFPFYERRSGMADKDRLEEFITEIDHIIHWRKIAMASAKGLPFKEYRSLRGETGRRG
jgi:hypothetical protein